MAFSLTECDHGVPLYEVCHDCALLGLLLDACRGALAHLVSGDLTRDMALQRLRTAISQAEGTDVREN